MSSGKSSRISVSCLACKKVFLEFPSTVKNGRRYCSKKCYAQHYFPSLEERLWNRVVKTQDCWEWQGKKLPRGYGLIRAGRGKERTMLLVHRLSWEFSNKMSVPKGLWVLHRCDNPSCVNPDHLFIGTPKDNSQDMIRKGRQGTKTNYGEKNGSSKLTQAQVDEIRNRLDIKPSLFAHKYGVSKNCIYRIRNNQNWVVGAKGGRP